MFVDDAISLAQAPRFVPQHRLRKLGLMIGLSDGLNVVTNVSSAWMSGSADAVAGGGQNIPELWDDFISPSEGIFSHIG